MLCSGAILPEQGFRLCRKASAKKENGAESGAEGQEEEQPKSTSPPFKRKRRRLNFERLPDVQEDTRDAPEAKRQSDERASQSQ